MVYIPLSIDRLCFPASNVIGINVKMCLLVLMSWGGEKEVLWCQDIHNQLRDPHTAFFFFCRGEGGFKVGMHIEV